jgi:hypothetical protein
MERYLQQLRLDVRQAIMLAPSPMEAEFMVNLEDDEPIYEPACLKVSLPILLGIHAEAFPPGAFLTERQMESLVIDITSLWNAYRLSWDMPPNLSVAQQYSALLRAMKEEAISWHSTIGGVVKICQYETGSFCPYGSGGNCYCKMANEAAQRDLELWEEHVRSQGIDPYEELSQEAGAAFQAESKRRAILRRNEDEWSDLWLDESVINREGSYTSFSNEKFDVDITESWLGFIISEDDTEMEERLGTKNDLDNPTND